ncbi:MAG: NRDE family protein, partial [Pseudomonadota bacterium]|nr:NRDE family protein [Pseudomonadota bacterium]
MCLAAWSVAQHPGFPWVIATNRDEYFDRAAAPLAWWRPQPDAAPILGGRDLLAGGTWLGLSAEGGFALVTNVRGTQAADATLASRGELVTASLAIGADDQVALAALASVPRNGFNLLRADLRSADGIWVTNRPFDQRRFGSGMHGLSNAALDTPWPKVRQLKQRLAAAVVGAD